MTAVSAEPIAPNDAERATIPALAAEGLVRTFGARRAVDGVSLALDAGDCLALFGPNGAGKTTLLRLLAGLLRPAAGAARVGGVAVGDGAAARARVGLISHYSLLYGALTARENVEFAARLYGVRDAAGAATAALERMRILDRAETPARRLSRGLQQRVSIARAVVHATGVVLFREPFTGLDEAGAAALTAAVRDMRAHGAALLLVTHNLTEGLTLGTHVGVMFGGRLRSIAPRADVDAARFAAEYRALVTSGP